MIKQEIIRDQLQQKINAYVSALEHPIPGSGWIRATRNAIGMTLQQLADRLSVTKQAVHAIEMREKDGAITIQSLRETAQALDMKLVYAIIPREGNIDDYIEKRAYLLAQEIVMRTSQTMMLEDQDVSQEYIRNAIEKRKDTIMNDLPKAIWD